MPFSLTKLAALIWRDYNTNGVPSSGKYSPPKGDIRTWGLELEQYLSGQTALDQVNIDGGAIDGTPIGAASRASGKFTGLEANQAFTFTAGGAISGTVTGNPTLPGNPILSGSPEFTGSPNFSGAANKPGIRSALGLGLGVDVQVFNAFLKTLADAGIIQEAHIASGAITLAKIAAAAKSGQDATLITGTAGADGSVPAFNADGDIVQGFEAGSAANNLLQLDGSGALPAVDGSQLTGIKPAAFAQFDGRGGITLNKQNNVSSVTQLGTGSYRINFTTALADANFVTLVACNSVAADGYGGTGNSRTTGRVDIRTYEAGNLTDQDDVNVVVFQ